MLFSSIPFLYYFLPCVLMIYFVVPRTFKNPVLLVASLVFYAWGEPKYVLLMVISILWGYVSGLVLGKYRTSRYAKLMLAVFVAGNVAALGYFKYADFFIENFNEVTGFSIPLLKVALPVGISFYTFQILSYTIDVYRGSVAVQCNVIIFSTYVAMFPQLIAGPIVRYSDLTKQLNSRKHSLDKAALGIRRFVLGLAKKILIANALGELCDIFKTSDDKSVMFYWLYAIAFTLHIYFDFSGYSDMAIGLGRLLGFDFMENFNYPYISRSITEFWRRWHISLGSWFRDYVYIPMGGNRCSKCRWMFNILFVWFLTGFWHGAAWNFILWGLYFAVLLIVEKLWLLKCLEKSKLWCHLYVLFLVTLSFVIFNGADVAEAFSYIGGMFGYGGIPLVSVEGSYYLRSFGVVLVMAILGATPLPKKLMEWIEQKKIGEMCIAVLEPIALAGLMLVMTAYLVDGSFNPFLYFRF